MATTLLELITRVGRSFGPLHEGTATGGGTSTVVDTSLIEPDDYWNNHYVYVHSADSAAPEGEERVVTDWVQATATLTVSPVFTAAVEAGDEYLALPVRRSELVALINNALDKACKRWGVPTIDTTTITLVESTYQYNLPTDLLRISDVLYRSDSESPYRVIERALWTIGGTPGAQVLDLLSLGSMAAGDTLRIDYLAQLPHLSADSDALTVGTPAEPELSEFIEEWCRYRLHTQAASRGISAGTFREHLTLARNAKESAERMLETAPRRERAGRVHSPQRPSILG